MISMISVVCVETLTLREVYHGPVEVTSLSCFRVFVVAFRVHKRAEQPLVRPSTNERRLEIIHAVCRDDDDGDAGRQRS